MTLGYVKWRVLFLGLVVAFTASFSLALTDPRDVAAVNSLFLSLNSPPLNGWIPFGGDPCGEEWEGVSCVFSNITTLNLRGLSLGGTLSNNLDLFESIIVIDLTDNHIEGSIPANLPPTLRNLSFAGNRFSGSIPDTVSSLTQLLDLSFHNNHLSGGIPDAFQPLMSLANLDLSGNNLSGQLPPSLGNLLSLSFLHLQNNKLVGTLDVLQDLPLEYLNVENNLFSGPIPETLLNIPNFRKDGNPFNTSIIPSPPPAVAPAVAPSAGIPPSSAKAPWKQYGPSASETPKPKNSGWFFKFKRFFWIPILVVVVVILLGVCLLVAKCCKRRRLNEGAERHDLGSNKVQIMKSNSKTSFQQSYQEEKVPKESIIKLQDQYGLDNTRLGMGPKSQGEQETDLKRTAAHSIQKTDHKIDMPSVDVNLMSWQLRSPPPPCLPVDKVTINPLVPTEVYTRARSSNQSPSLCSTRVFTIAELQQYTNSFSEENFVGEGTLGSVYRAELPDGTALAVKKLNITVSRQQNDLGFIELVPIISKIKHANVVEHVGYCCEHGQHLLVYKYCENGTLYDALHVDEDIHKKLSWNVRIRIALGAARALQYLHEVCQPPIVHWDFKSSNILLDDKLAACVSDCGLADLKPYGSTSELSGSFSVHGYAAPEIETGSYTCKSDIYSFGVVMLELLTGRQPYNRSRSRGEQSLVRWAIPQLHDIDALSRMVDPSIKGACPVKDLSRFADIISRCVQWEPEFRPAMSEIVQDLLHMV